MTLHCIGEEQTRENIGECCLERVSIIEIQPESLKGNGMLYTRV